MKPYFLFTCLLFASLVSCNRVNNHNDADSIEPYVYSDDLYSDFSRFADTLSDNEYHQKIIEAIANGDKQLFAQMVSYPLERRYPLHNIENEEQMIRYFDTLFDVSFREKVSKFDSNSWGCLPGGRGWMLYECEIIADPRIIVDYLSPLEQSHAEYLRKKDMARLHKSLQGEWQPYACFLIDASGYPDFEYSYARIDVINADDEDAVFRLALYQKGENASAKPSLVMFGQRSIDGMIHAEWFVFDSDNCEIEISYNYPSRFYMHYKNGKKYGMASRMAMQPFDK